MSANKWTPGPWTAIAGPVEHLVIRDSDGDCVARLYRDDCPDWRLNEANARLIAAAPELYEELAQLEEWFNALANSKPDLTETANLWRGRIRLLLAKAQGEQ